MKPTILILASMLTGCGHVAAYRPTTAPGNQCENECLGISRSCGDSGACRSDLAACRRRCFDFNGGEYASATTFFWEQPTIERK